MFRNLKMVFYTHMASFISLHGCCLRSKPGKEDRKWGKATPAQKATRIKSGELPLGVLPGWC